MGAYFLIGALLLLFAESSRSLDTATLVEEETTSLAKNADSTVLPSLEIPHSAPESIQKLEPKIMEMGKIESSATPVAEKIKSGFSGKVKLSSADPLKDTQLASSVLETTASSPQSKKLKSDSATSSPNETTGTVKASMIIELSTAQSPLLPSNATFTSGQVDSRILETTKAPNTDDPATSQNMSILPIKPRDNRPRKPTADFGSTEPSITKGELDHTSTAADGLNITDEHKEGKEPGSATNTIKRSLDPTTPALSTVHSTSPNQSSKDSEKNRRQKIFIGVGIIILILLLLTIVFFALRKKKRSGSFRTQSRKGAGKDVWAGQVPELGDGKGTQDPALVQNGRVGTQSEPGQEQEMVTFVSGEKKDSVDEVNEIEAGGKAEANGGNMLGKEDEEIPLLNEKPEAPQEQESIKYE